MPKLAANLPMLVPELAFLDRFAAAARAGFRDVGYPYACRATEVAERTRDRVRARGRLRARIDHIGYAGWIGCEYNPAGDTRAGLARAKPYL